MPFDIKYICLLRKRNLRWFFFNASNNRCLYRYSFSFLMENKNNDNLSSIRMNKSNNWTIENWEKKDFAETNHHSNYSFQVALDLLSTNTFFYGNHLSITEENFSRLLIRKSFSQNESYLSYFWFTTISSRKSSWFNENNWNIKICSWNFNKDGISKNIYIYKSAEQLPRPYLP